MKEKYMTEAAKEAYTGIENGHGGPFGSVIVKDDKIVGRGHNRVLYKQDHLPRRNGSHPRRL